MAFSQAWTAVQKNQGAGTTVTTGSLTTTSGNTIVVGVTRSDATPGTTDVTDSKGNTYTRINTAVNTDRIALYYAENITGGASHTITLNNLVAHDTFACIAAVELSGVLTSGVSDVTTTNTGTATTLSSGSATTTDTDDLVGYFTSISGSNGTWNTSGSSTVRSSIGRGDLGTTGGMYTRDAVAAGSNSVAGNFNSENNAYAGILGSFKNTGGVAAVYARTIVRSKAVVRAANY